MNNENLKPFKKGQGGRKKGGHNRKTKAIQQLCQDVLELDPYSGKKMSQAETEIFFKWWIIYNPTVAKHFLEHAHGKPKETHDVNIKKWLLEGPNGEPIRKKRPDDINK